MSTNRTKATIHKAISRKRPRTIRNESDVRQQEADKIKRIKKRQSPPSHTGEAKENESVTIKENRIADKTLARNCEGRISEFWKIIDEPTNYRPRDITHLLNNNTTVEAISITACDEKILHTNNSNDYTLNDANVIQCSNISSTSSDNSTEINRGHLETILKGTNKDTYKIRKQEALLMPISRMELPWAIKLQKLLQSSSRSKNKSPYNQAVVLSKSADGKISKICASDDEEIHNTKSSDTGVLQNRNIEGLVNKAKTRKPIPLSRKALRLYNFSERMCDIIVNITKQYVDESESDDTDDSSTSDSDSSYESTEEETETLPPIEEVIYRPCKLIPEPKTIGVIRVKVKDGHSLFCCASHLGQTERSNHSVKTPVQLRRVQKLLELNTAPRSNEKGILRFNMIRGQIPDVIETLKVYTNSSHHALVQFTDSKQGFNNSQAGEIYFNCKSKKQIGDCSICMYTYSDDTVTTWCGHIFCKNCLVHAIEYRKQCPSCKKQLKWPYYHKIYL